MVEPCFQLVIGSHYFKVIKPTSRIRGLIQQFSEQYSVKGMVSENGRQVFKTIKRFVLSTDDRSEYRMHIGQLKPFVAMLEDNHIDDSLYTVEEIGVSKPKSINLKVKPNWILKDYQEDCKKFILKPDPESLRSKLVALPTGTGKTVLALCTLGELANPIVIVVLPTYMDKWAGDVLNILNVKAKDIMLIRGGDQLRGLVQLAKEGKANSKVYIISLNTLSNAIKDYQTNNGNLEEMGFDSPIEELYINLGAGALLLDETHQMLHQIYKVICFSHVPLVLGLSATLLSNDHTLDHIQKTIFPKELRYEKIKMKKYIKTLPIGYNFKDMAKAQIRTTERGSRNYSHVALERSILKNKSVKDNYLEMIAMLVESSYIKDYKDGDKCIIFAASKLMCAAIVERLKQKMPLVDTRRYVMEDPYENAIESQIRVTTIQSCGTAIDIPGLRVTILTNSISSQVSNLQCFGRLRELKDRDCKFFYLHCQQIPKHKQYHQAKMELLYDRSLAINELFYPTPI